MNRNKMSYEVFLDSTATPPMYGIRCGSRTSAHRISTDFQEVHHLASLCNDGDLSGLHLGDVAEDFGRS